MSAKMLQFNYLYYTNHDQIKSHSLVNDLTTDSSNVSKCLGGGGGGVLARLE